ncbi:alpha/beta hydrolase [Natroniella acetigena]|uniref:alpha/beta hydrolase n=1 Tax=Natroniella acetigena TaxID=52004 RepID=UPI002009FFC7|nr:alpha/beta fold hydrolase [Natroniella acetigena]MCK8826443.1 alpha/beta hydrolase [Natroniella acetigena]
MKNKWLKARSFKDVLVIVLVIYGILLAAFYLFQDHLLFRKSSLTEERLQEIEAEYPQAEEVELEMADGVRLHGWLVKAAEQNKAPLIIYFGGNAEEVSGVIEKEEKFEGYSLLVVNYRGYGLSEGEPEEDKLFSDALYLYDHFTTLESIDSEKVLTMGRSLGTGVAVHLAANRDVRGVILVSPYDSIENLAQDIFPFLPMELILKHEFDSISKAPDLEVPVLILAAEDDRIVPVDYSKALYDKWSGGKEFKVIVNRGHNNLHRSKEFWEYISDFIQNLNLG